MMLRCHVIRTIFHYPHFPWTFGMCWKSWYLIRMKTAEKRFASFASFAKNNMRDSLIDRWFSVGRRFYPFNTISRHVWLTTVSFLWLMRAYNWYEAHAQPPGPETPTYEKRLISYVRIWRNRMPHNRTYDCDDNNLCVELLPVGIRTFGIHKIILGIFRFFFPNIFK